jgi:hypothetical protein
MWIFTHPFPKKENLYFSATANYGQKKTEATVYLTSLWVVSTALKFVSWWAFSF